MGFFPRMHASASGSVSLSDERAWVRIFGNGKSKSGVTVSEHTATNLPAVYCAVGLIADAIAMLPVDVCRKAKRGHSVESGHPVEDLLNKSPNPYMSAFTVRNTRLYHTLLWGNGYQEIERDQAGRPVGLWPLLPESTTPEKQSAGDLAFRTVIDGKSYRLPQENVLHVLAMGHNGYVGISPIAVAREAVGLGLAMQEFGAKFFANDAKSGGFLMHPGKLGEKATVNIQQSMEKKSGLDNAHRVKILEEGMKFVSTTIPPEDAQFLGSREFQIAEIARIYRVPTVLLQSMEKATSWGSGIEQMMIGFLTHTLQPWITKEEQEYNRKLFTQAERDAGFFVKLNINAIMRADMAGRAGFYNQGITNGWLTRNEVREKEDLNPLPGLDKALVPLNMQNGNEPEEEREDEI